MTEFTEYLALDHREGKWTARKLPEGMSGKCVVDHPDAGGLCGHEATYEVYGLPFCERHGLEANAGALAQLYHEGLDEFDRMDNRYALPLQPELLRVVRDARVWTRDQQRHYSKVWRQIVGEVYPLNRQRVDQETRDWDVGGIGGAPVDWWSDEYAEICSLMLKAYTGLTPALVKDLEPLRERAAAQYAFALIIDEEKIAVYKATREK